MNRFPFSLSASCLLFASAAAQDEVPNQNVQSEQRMVIAAQDDEGGQIQMSAIQITSDGSGDIVAFAEPMVFAGDMAMTTADLAQALINDPNIQQELELLPDQQQQLSQLQQEFGKEMKSVIDGIVRNPDADKTQLPSMLKDLRSRQSERMNEVLLPHQIDRLRQISFQRNVSNAGMSSVLTSSEIAEKLGIDEEQQQRLKERAEELKKEFEAKVAALKEEMKEELLKELTPGQRKQIEEMTGAAYEFKNEGGLRRFTPPRIRSRAGRDSEQ